MTESFFSDHGSLSFHMIHKFAGTTFSLSVPTEFLWLGSHFNHQEKRCRAHFSKSCKKSYFPTTQINGFTYIMSEAVVPSFPLCSCFVHFPKYRWRVLTLVMTACGNFAFNWILCVYSFIQLISLRIKPANW